MTPLNPQSEIRNPKSNRAFLSAFAALTLALIVSATARAGEARHPDAVPVFHCAFGEDWDVNYDGWPDRWVRKTGTDYPHYVNIAIQDDEAAAGKKCLKIDLDGAAAAIESPPIRVMSRFSYAFEAQLKCEGLEHSTAVITLDFCDSAGKVLQTTKSEPIATTAGWQSVSLGQVEPRDPAIDRVVLGLQVLRSNKGDLHGHVSLADVRLERLPRIDVSTNNPCNVYTELTGVVVKCALSGIRERDPEIHFQLLDGANQELQSERFPLDGQLIVDDSSSDAEITDGGEGPDGFEGTKSWQPKIPDYGFYRVVVRMMSAEAKVGQADAERQLGSPRTVDLVVVPPLPMPRRGEFGWTLPNGDQPLSFQDLSRLLPEVGINWAKVPVWFDANNPRRGDELIRFVELLGASNIDVVGVIDRPPHTQRGARAVRETAIADVLTQDSSTWSAALEPVMTRLSLRVRWWQLGRDFDNSLIGLPTLNKRIEDLRTALFRFGQDVRMGLCADWESADTYSGKVAWDFVQLGLQTQPSEKKFAELLASERRNSAQRWIIVEPPPRMTEANDMLCLPIGSVTTSPQFMIPAWVQAGIDSARNGALARTARATAFVHRLVTAKVSGAEAIIVAKPFDDDNGLLRADGMPAELLLPWRTTAAMLGGAQYLGEMQLPGDSHNRVFLRPDGQVVMVVWNRQPTREVLYLGESVRQFDLLGRSAPAAKQGREQAIDVGPTPSFVLGLQEAITRWRMSVAFDKTQVPSVFSKPHHNALSFKNFFPQGVGGTLKIVVLEEREANIHSDRQDSAVGPGFTLDRWTIEPPHGTFQVAADGETKFPFDIKLKDALFGKQPVRIDFTVEADEKYEFSAYRELAVGTEDLTLDVKSRLDADGTLIVEQRMTNRSGRLADFKCYLQTRGERPQRMQVYRLGPEPNRKLYRFADGAKLVGKEMQLVIEELNGQRVIKYRFVAGAPSPISEEADASDAAKSEDADDEEPKDTLRPLARLGS